MYGLAVLITFIEDLWPVRRPPAFKSIPMVADVYLSVSRFVLVESKDQEDEKTEMKTANSLLTVKDNNEDILYFWC